MTLWELPYRPLLLLLYIHQQTTAHLYFPDVQLFHVDVDEVQVDVVPELVTPTPPIFPTHTISELVASSPYGPTHISRYSSAAFREPPPMVTNIVRVMTRKMPIYKRLSKVVSISALTSFVKVPSGKAVIERLIRDNGKWPKGHVRMSVKQMVDTAWEILVMC